MSNLTRKRKKRERINRMLDSLRTPKTCQQLERDLGAERNYFTKQLVALFLTGHVVIVGTQWKANIWQAVKFDYREEDIDYEPVIIKTPINTLADAVYRHDPERHAQQYKDTSKLVRDNRQYTKIGIGISPIYHG